MCRMSGLRWIGHTLVGFKLDRQNEEDDEINWAKLTFGNSEVMF
jgi:hypothetical protein